jgi:hypothetical protein
LLHDKIYLFQKIFLANIQTLTKFLNCLYKIKLIHSQARELQNLLSKLNNFPVFRWPLIPHAKEKQLDQLSTAQLGLRYLLSLLPPPPPTRPTPGSPSRPAGHRSERHRRPRRHSPDGQTQEDRFHFKPARQLAQAALSVTRETQYRRQDPEASHNRLALCTRRLNLNQ